MDENCWRNVKKIFADGGYSGKLAARIQKVFGIEVQIVKKIGVNHFQVLPKRWIVERTSAWLDTYRRNSKDYERLTQSSKMMILLSSIQLMLLKSKTASYTFTADQTFSKSHSPHPANEVIYACILLKSTKQP